MAPVSQAQLIFAAVLYSLALSSHCHLASYDCSNTTVLQYGVPISDLLPPCDSLREAGTAQGMIVQVSPSSAIISYRCRVSFTVSIVDAGGSKRVISNGTEPINKDTCLTAHRTKTMTLNTNRIPFLQPNGTVNHSVVIDSKLVDGRVSGNQIHHHYIKTYEISLRQVVGHVNLQHNTIRFDDVICDYDEYRCESGQYGQYFWNPIDAKNYSLIYKGLISFVRKRVSLTSQANHYAVLTSPSQHKAFVLLAFGGGNLINGSRAFSTELPGVYIIMSGSGYRGPTTGWESDERFKSIYTVSYYGKIKAVDLGRRRCESDNLDRYLRLKSSPTLSRVMLTPLGMIGISINAAMESFEVLRCKESDVVSRKTEKCYNELPVEDKYKNPKFLNPITRILSDDAEVIPCEEEAKNMTVDTSLKLRDEITSNGTFASVESTSGEALKELHLVESDEVDWMKILGLVSLAVWISAIIARWIKLTVGYFLRKCYKREPQNKNTELKSAVTCASVNAFIELCKPPFMGTCFECNRTQRVGAILPEPAVSYVVY